MESFYAGPQGQSIVIKERFSSIAEMASKFQQGRSYTDVWFGEYCLIATKNINDGHNGMMFRRGINYNDTTWGGAEYIGQFVGTSSGTPFFNVTSIKDLDNLFQKKKDGLLNGNDSELEYPESIDERYRYLPSNASDTTSADVAHTVWGDGVADDGISAEPIFKSDVNLKELSYDVSNALVSGETNNKIKFKWFNVRTNNASSDSWIHVGFEIPYPFFKFTGVWTSPYDANTGATKTDDKAILFHNNTDYKANPFYNKWTVEIPRGIKGDTLRNLRIVTVADISNKLNDNGTIISVYNWSDILQCANAEDGHIEYNRVFDNNGNCKLTPANFVLKGKVNKDAQVLVVDYYVYDACRNPHVITASLGLVRNIRRVTLEDGIFKVEYTDGSVYSSIVDYITNISINTTTGQTTLTHSTVKEIDSAGNKIYNTSNGERLDWVTNIGVTDKGKVYRSRTGLDGTLSLDGMSIPRGETTGTVIKYIKDIAVDKDTNRMTINYNTGEVYNRVMKSLRNVSLDTGLNDDKRIKVTYNVDKGDGTWAAQTESIGNSLNDIEFSFVNGSNYHLYILWSDKAHRPDTTTTNGPTAAKWANRTWVLNANQNAKDMFGKDMSNTNYSGLYWQDMGAVKDQAGILVGYHLTNEVMRTTTLNNFTGSPFTSDESVEYSNARIIEFLNAAHPKGITNEGLNLSNEGTASKLVVYSRSSDNTDSEKRKFFAYDYNKAVNGWFYIGTFGEDNKRDVYIWDGAENDTNMGNKLRTEGVAFYRQPRNKRTLSSIGELWKNA